MTFTALGRARGNVRTLLAVAMVSMIVVAAALLIGSSASAKAPATTSKHFLKVTPAEVKPGKRVRLHGSVDGCPKGDRAVIYSDAFKHATKHEFAGVPAVYAKVGKHGAFSHKVKINKKIKKGMYNVGGRCGGGHFGSATLKVS